ncbi:MAG: hypothetical protein JXA09_18290 [Anaerolineae bacterium]|nr:hypothetical protein [Anaerolineae bacterium]
MSDASSRQDLWWRWVTANAFGELFGLGLTFAAVGVTFPRLEALPGAAGVLLAFAVAVASGAIEATVVGVAQWWAMRPWFPAVTRTAWWQATLAGALLAYVAGYLPSTLIGLGQQAGGAPVAEPPQGVVPLLAAGMGAVAGAVLSFAQWLVLRRHVARAGLWVPANALAWLVGMPVIFWAMDAVFAAGSALQSALLLAGALYLTGAIVGAIHGAFLVRLAPHRAAARAEQESLDLE